MSNPLTDDPEFGPATCQDLVRRDSRDLVACAPRVPRVGAVAKETMTECAEALERIAAS